MSDAEPKPIGELPPPTREAMARPTGPDVFKADAFRGRVYGITGAAGAIASALAEALAQLEARLVLVDRREDALHQFADKLRDDGAEVCTVVGDLAERAVVERAVDTGVQTWQRVDGWVNNAMQNVRGGLEQLTDDKVASAWHVNVEAARIAVQRLLPTLRAQRSGSIVNVSSVLAHQTRDWDGLYASTKGALEACTRAWALELGEWGVRVNTVIPGNTSLPPDFDQPHLTEAHRQAYWARVRATTPRQLPTVPRDTANAIIFLLSDAACAITGTELKVDGGVSVEYRQTRHSGRRAAMREATASEALLEDLGIFGPP